MPPPSLIAAFQLLIYTKASVLQDCIRYLKPVIREPESNAVNLKDAVRTLRLILTHCTVDRGGDVYPRCVPLVY